MSGAGELFDVVDARSRIFSRSRAIAEYARRRGRIHAFEGPAVARPG